MPKIPVTNKTVKELERLSKDLEKDFRGRTTANLKSLTYDSMIGFGISLVRSHFEDESSKLRLDAQLDKRSKNDLLSVLRGKKSTAGDLRREQTVIRIAIERMRHLLDDQTFEIVSKLEFEIMGILARKIEQLEKL